MQINSGSPGGLPKFSQKTLLKEIENSGGLDRYRNQIGKKKQVIRPLLLEKFLIYLVILVIHNKNEQGTI